MFLKHLALPMLMLMSVLFLPPARADHQAGNPVQLRILEVRNAQGLVVAHPAEGEDSVLRLSLVDREGHALTDQDLEFSHERLVHLFAWDLGLENYAHEHPEHRSAEPGVWEARVRFRQAGRFRLWADFHLADRHREVTADSVLDVDGPSAPHGIPAALEPLFSASDRGSVLTLEDAQSLHAGRLEMVTLRFSREDGSLPVLTPYLGALAHAVITDLRGDALVHAHPMEMEGGLMLHLVFPKAGDYRAFIQFVDAGVLRTVALNLRVK